MSSLDDALGVVMAHGGVPVQILFVDLLLSADNALLIAMACRGLSDERMRHAASVGTAGAILMRIAMAGVVVELMAVPFLKIACAGLLLWIAIRLLRERDDDEAMAALEGRSRRKLWGGDELVGAVVAIIAADAVMSLDNVVAIAAIADGNMVLVAIGLAMSIPMLVYGSALIRPFLQAHQGLVIASGFFLGWIAGAIGVSDAAVAPWVAANGMALPFTVPLACAIYVPCQAWLNAPHAGRHRDGV